MELALAALEEKPNAILIEKPVCTPALEYANELLSMGKARGCLLFVGYDHVVGTAANRFCELVDQNVMGKALTLDVEFREHWAGILTAHPWLDQPANSYLGFWRRGGGATGEHSHGLNLWQHFAHRLGLGRVTQVTATLDYVQDCGGDYDRLCLVNLATEHGFVGRVVQDVLTRPTRKWARLQGANGFVEWVCGQETGTDAVNFSDSTSEVIVEKFAKTRPEEFILELKHIAAVMKGDIGASDLAIERGLDTMMVVAAAHLSSRERKTVTIDWSKGIRTQHSGVEARRGLRGEDVEASFDFRNLFVLDLANNHQGSVEHGLEVIRRTRMWCISMACEPQSSFSSGTLIP